MTSKVLLLSWNPGHSHVTAGGFVRNREVIKRISNKEDFIIIDTYPSIYRGIVSEDQLYEYKIPLALKSLEIKFYSLERFLEWVLSIFLILFLGIKVCRTEYIRLIYAPSSEILVVSVSAVLLRFLKKKHLVFCNYNVRAVALSTKIILSISTFIHNRADCVISLSETLKREQKEAGIKPPIIINTVGLDLNIFDDYLKQYGKPTKVYDVILVARLVKEKGLYDLPKIFSLVKKAGINFKAVIVGEGSDRVKEDVLRELNILGLDNLVTFTGAVSENEKIQLYYQSKVCIFPSYVEGWGIVPQEAMACGLPVVAYALDVYKENIDVAPSVFQVPLGNIEEFAGTLIKLLKMNEVVLNELGQKGRVVVQKFDWEKIAHEEYDIISSFL